MGDNLYKTTGEFIPDKLIADNRIPVTTKGILIAAGQGFLKRGTLLGLSTSGTYKVTGTEDASGTVAVSEKGTTPETGDASGEEPVSETVEVPGREAGAGTVGCDCILADAVDATDEDVVAVAYVTGAFNRDALFIGEGAEIGSYETELRRLGIFLKTVQEY